MKTFVCSHCANKVYFENAECVKCGYALGFDARTLNFAAIEADTAGGGLYRRVDGNDAARVRYCANSLYGVCNWLTDERDLNVLCPACDLNRTIPNLNENGSLAAWGELERAKKRLIYSLLRFKLPFEASVSTQGPLTFDFVRDALTGHLDGVITIDIMEADAVERERQRQVFQEPYRSLLGHLRHESGHFYWKLLVEGAGRLEDFRTVFGDERQDYASALALHHGVGPPANWQARHVSSYASCHPWEDWAETWAHYLHMVDALDTAGTEGMEPRVARFSLAAIWPFRTHDMYREESFKTLMARWVPLTISLNSLSRSMGHNDFYPFVISTPAAAKLAFVHKLIRNYQK